MASSIITGTGGKQGEIMLHHYNSNKTITYPLEKNGSSLRLSFTNHTNPFKESCENFRDNNKQSIPCLWSLLSYVRFSLLQ